jgi:ATP-dependent RNA helicase RhlB
MLEDPQSSLEIKRAEKPEFLTKTRFDKFDLPAKVVNGLRDAGFIYCTPIQAQTLPVSLAGRDVAGQAQTGTGKTAAFLVTILTRLLGLSEEDRRLPSALIVTPTRELARQIYEEAEILARHTDLTMVQVVGGVDYGKQADTLRQGVDIIIGTPGRIIDYYKQKIFKTEGIKVLVIDEADRLLDLGFSKDMRYILRKLPLYEKRQSMLFSATLSYRVLELTYDFMNLPEFIAVTPETVTVEGIVQSLYHVGSDKKVSLLLGLLEREDWSRMLIFVNTKAGVEMLTHKLKGNGWPAQGITGDLPQPKRFRLMEQFKKGEIKILLATDVASRGIHVEDISHVINYDLPQDAENYIHRIGRTARAGKTGQALSLACEHYVFHLEPVEEMLGYKIPVVWPGDDWFVEDRSRPLARQRKPQPQRATPRRTRGTENDRRAHRKPSPKPSPKPRSSRFPGALFGFGPEPIPEPKPEPMPEPMPEPSPEPIPEPKPELKRNPPKKKMRPFRRRKRPSPKNSPAESKDE